MKEKILREIISLKIKLTVFIRHFRLFSKRCPRCNGFIVNGKKHNLNNCFSTLLRKIK